MKILFSLLYNTTNVNEFIFKKIIKIYFSRDNRIEQ